MSRCLHFENKCYKHKECCSALIRISSFTRQEQNAICVKNVAKPLTGTHTLLNTREFIQEWSPTSVRSVVRPSVLRHYCRCTGDFTRKRNPTDAKNVAKRIIIPQSLRNIKKKSLSGETLQVWSAWQGLPIFLASFYSLGNPFWRKTLQVWSV